jgi:hypothetical protein
VIPGTRSDVRRLNSHCAITHIARHPPLPSPALPTPATCRSKRISEKIPSGGMGRRRSSTRTPPWRSARLASRCQPNSGRQPSRRATGAKLCSNTRRGHRLGAETKMSPVPASCALTWPPRASHAELKQQRRGFTGIFKGGWVALRSIRQAKEAHFGAGQCDFLVSRDALTDGRLRFWSRAVKTGPRQRRRRCPIARTGATASAL